MLCVRGFDIHVLLTYSLWCVTILCCLRFYRVFVFDAFQLPALSTLQYNQALCNLEAEKVHGWFQLPECSNDVLPVIPHNQLSLPMQDMSSRQPSLIPTASGTQDPLPCDIKYSATSGPLSSEMKYPDTHAIPHGGVTHAGCRRTRYGSMGRGSRTAMLDRPTTADRDLYRAPAAAANLSAGGSLRRKSNSAGRPRETAFSTRHVGMPPSDHSQKHDWTARSELEYRVWRTRWSVYTQMHTHLVFRRTPPSQPNKAGLNVCPSFRTYVRPSTESFSNLNEIWCVGRGRWVMHDGMPYGPIPGQGQGHVALKVRNSSILKKWKKKILKIYLRHFQWELASDCWCDVFLFANLTRGQYLFDRVGFLMSVVVFVSHDFQLWRKLRCDWQIFSSNLHLARRMSRPSITHGANVGLTSHVLSKLGNSRLVQSPKVNSWELLWQNFTGRMPFLSPHRQCQSTEGWQCYWLGTACWHHAAMIGEEQWWLCGLHCHQTETEIYMKISFVHCVVWILVTNDVSAACPAYFQASSWRHIYTVSQNIFRSCLT